MACSLIARGSQAARNSLTMERSRMSSQAMASWAPPGNPLLASEREADAAVSTRYNW
jgi:hypothetical protein